MSTTRKLDKDRILEEYIKITENFICQPFAQKLFNMDKTELEITQTSKTISLKSNKVVCSQKIESKIITIDSKSIPQLQHTLHKFKFSNVNIQTESRNQKMREGQKLLTYILSEAVHQIGNQIQNWIINWEDHLSDRTLVISTIRLIEEQYQKINKEIQNIIEHCKIKGLFDSFQLNVRFADPTDLIDPLYNEFPELQDFLQTFDPTTFSAAELAELQQMNSELLPFIMEVDYDLKNKKKKKKKNRNKNKKKKKDIACKSSQTTKQEEWQHSEDEQRFNEVLQYLENLDIDLQSRVQCRTSEQWLASLYCQPLCQKDLL